MKIGILGADITAKEHIRMLKKSGIFETVGIYDTNPNQALLISKETGTFHFSNPEELIRKSDILDITNQVYDYLEFIIYGLKNSKHIFIDNPGNQSIESASNLIKIAEESDSLILIGRKGLLNPAFISAKSYIDNPFFIEIERNIDRTLLPSFNDLILNYFISDIDLLNSILNIEVRKIVPAGYSILSDTVDFINARIEFANSSIAHLSTTFLYDKNTLHIKIYQKSAIINIDFTSQEAQIIRLSDKKGDKKLKTEKIPVKQVNVLKEQFLNLKNAIENKSNAFYSLHDNYNSLLLATKIVESIIP